MNGAIWQLSSSWSLLEKIGLYGCLLKFPSKYSTFVDAGYDFDESIEDSQSNNSFNYGD